MSKGDETGFWLWAKRVEILVGIAAGLGTLLTVFLSPAVAAFIHQTVTAVTTTLVPAIAHDIAPVLVVLVKTGSGFAVTWAVAFAAKALLTTLGRGGSLGSNVQARRGLERMSSITKRTASDDTDK